MKKQGKLYLKVLNRGRVPIYGRRSYKWPRLGTWTERVYNPSMCHSGYHMTTPAHLINWIGPEIYVAESGGLRARQNDHRDKVCYEQARLLKQVEWNDRIAAAWLAEVLAEIKTDKFSDERKEAIGVWIDLLRDRAQGKKSPRFGRLVAQASIGTIRYSSYDDPIAILRLHLSTAGRNLTDRYVLKHLVSNLERLVSYRKMNALLLKHLGLDGKLA